MDGKALEKIKRGVETIYEPVRRTLGPECGTTLMYRTYNRGPRNVDDGYYTAEAIEPKDPHVKLVADFYKEGIRKTNEKVGDGTSTTNSIAGTLFNEAYKILSETSGIIKSQTAGNKTGRKALSRAILGDADIVKKAIRAAAKKVESLQDVEKIARISLGDDTTSKVVAGMAWEVGTDGFIDVVEGFRGELETEVIKGMRFPAKVPHKAFVNNPARYESIMEDCPVFITNYKIDNAAQMAFTQNLKTSKLIVIAPEFSDTVLIALAKAVKNGFFVYPVAAPSLRTEQWEDLATYCDARFINKSEGRKIENVMEHDLGFLEKLVVKDTEAKEDACATGGRGTSTATGQSKIQERIEVLQKQREEMKQENFKKMIDRRIASMASAVGIIRVGSPTDAETLPLKLKIEDTVYACKAAIRSGYVKGGGLCLKEIAETLPETSLLKVALQAPYNHIQENAGGSLEIGDDVIDPADAAYYAVEHATSVVASLITIKNLIPEEPEESPAEGYRAIARAINEFVIGWKIREGVMKASNEEQERDRLMQYDALEANDNG